MAAPPASSYSALKKQWTDATKAALTEASAIVKELDALQKATPATLPPMAKGYVDGKKDVAELKKRVDALEERSKGLAKLEGTVVVW